MHSALLLAASLGSVVVSGLAVPESASRANVRRSEGSLESGFLIPRDVQDGVWKAKFENGGWTHTLISNATEATDVGVIEKRENIGPVENLDWIMGTFSGCRDDGELDYGDTDRANMMIDDQCRNNPTIRAGEAYWSNSHRVISFACNGEGADRTCDLGQHAHATRRITANCGPYRTGWTQERWQYAKSTVVGLWYGYQKIQDNGHTHICGFDINNINMN